MCRSMAEGGQRCSAHTRAAMQRRAKTLENALKSGNQERVATARTKWEEAVAAYASTGKGLAEVQGWADQADSQNDPYAAEMYRGLLRRGMDMRAAANQTRSMINAARRTAGLAPITATETAEPLDPGLLVSGPAYVLPAHEEAARTFTASLHAAQERTANEVAAAMARGDQDDYRAALGRLQSFGDTERAYTQAVATLADPDVDGQRLAEAIRGLNTQHGVAGGPAVQAQIRRALTHPNADAATFAAAAENDYVPVTAFATEKCPDYVLARVVADYHHPDAAPLNPGVWKHVDQRLRWRPDHSLVVTAALHHPDKHQRTLQAVTATRANLGGLSRGQFVATANALSTMSLPERVKMATARRMYTWADHNWQGRGRAAVLATLRGVITVATRNSTPKPPDAAAGIPTVAPARLPTTAPRTQPSDETTVLPAAPQHRREVKRPRLFRTGEPATT